MKKTCILLLFAAIFTEYFTVNQVYSQNFDILIGSSLNTCDFDITLPVLRYYNSSSNKTTFFKEQVRNNRIYLGIGFAKAFRIKDDEFARNNDIRFLLSLGYLFPIYQNLYLNIGIDYNKNELGGYYDHYNFIFSPNYKFTLNKKTVMFLDAGVDMVWIFDRGNPQEMQIGFTSAVKAEYQISNRFSAGMGLRYLNFFDQRNESYFIMHCELFISFNF